MTVVSEQQVPDGARGSSKGVEISFWGFYVVGLVCVLWNAVDDPEWWRWVLVALWACVNLSLLLAWRRRRDASGAGSS